MALPNLEVDELEWFHPNLTRHQAEALLMQNGCNGSYLLRDSSDKSQYSLSCRCSDSVKHFKIQWNGSQFIFGMGKFASMQDFVNHFKNNPLIGGESGVLTLLQVPYPRNIEEPEDYETVHVHAEWGKKQPEDEHKHAIPSSINSKEGFLVKQGGVVKNWKNRWFVLHKNELKYFKTKGEPMPIRTLDLDKCIEVVDNPETGKDFSFGVVMPNRTFFLCASSEPEKMEWLKILKWKMGKLHDIPPTLSEQTAASLDENYNESLLI